MGAKFLVRVKFELKNVYKTINSIYPEILGNIDICLSGVVAKFGFIGDNMQNNSGVDFFASAQVKQTN